MRIARREAFAVAAAAALVTAAFVLPRMNWGINPRSDIGLERFAQGTGAAPIFGYWDAHVSWGTAAAIALALAAVLWGPTVAQRLSWRLLTLGTWATACGWAFSLAMIDGWRHGFAERLTTRDEYLNEVPGITDIAATVRTFSSRIVDFAPHSWTTHTSGHPPGALLTFVWLDRLGLHGGAWAGLLCLLAGSSAAAAVIVAVRAVADEATARRAAPFVALAPTAIWVAVSADGYFAGVAAWGIALLALAVHGTARYPALVGAAAGLVLGWGILLSYGLALMGLPALAVLISAADWRPALRALGPAVLSAVAVAVTFAVSGFYWFDGYNLVQQRYWQGVAKDRPFQYWSWANLADVVCSIGLGSVAGVSRAFDKAAIRRRSGFQLLMLAALAAIVCADLSMLSKAETERIWLPFTIWLTAAPALLPVRSHRVWLAVNAAGALALNSFIFTNW
ncbi:MAG: methylthioxylose transferase [Mycobacterium sp.]|nr:methylthioxylose transferase [Mycobacterium sp.]